jgi:N-acetylglutamate synthase-like GNAT family acetyltransferase
LTHAGQAVGVIRVDIDGETATFRRVAIVHDKRRSGHGRALMSLSESFAAEKGCRRLYSFVSPDAVGFYEKCGFVRDPNARESTAHVPMQKHLS